MSEQNEIVRVAYTDYKKVKIKDIRAAINWCMEEEPIFIETNFYSNGKTDYSLDQMERHVKNGTLYRAVKVMTEKITMFRYTYKNGGTVKQTPWISQTFDRVVSGWGSSCLKTEEKEVEINK